MNEFKYETHCHTSEVSPCAKAPALSVVEHYAQSGYTGIWITDHFVCNREGCWERRVTDHQKGFEIAFSAGKEAGLDVFFGFEYALHPQAGTDFLVYGLTPEWLLRHPEIDSMCTRDCLGFMLSEGALIFHAHPFRESGYIEMIRLLPRYVTGVEIINANRTDNENRLAAQYADNYGLKTFAGSDNHLAGNQKRFCGLLFPRRAESAADWCKMVKNDEYALFDTGVKE